MPLIPVRAKHKSLSAEAWTARAHAANLQLGVAKTPMQVALAVWKRDTFAAAGLGAVVATPARVFLGEGSASAVERLISAQARDEIPLETGAVGLVKFVAAGQKLLDSEVERLEKRFGTALALARRLRTQVPRVRLDAPRKVADLAALTALWNAEHKACNNALDLLMFRIDALQPIAMEMSHWQARTLPTTLSNWVPEGQTITVHSPEDLTAIRDFYDSVLEKMGASLKYLSQVSGQLATTQRVLQSAAKASAWQPPSRAFSARRLSVPVERAPRTRSTSAADLRAELCSA